MDDSWPASPRAEELSDSISRHAAEIERALLALEAVEAFRAEAAALRADLQAAKAQPARRPVFSPIVAPELSPGTWRLIVEAGFLVGVAVAAWAFRLHRLEIVIAMGTAWLIVAVVEAIAYHRSDALYGSQVPLTPPALEPEPQANGRRLRLRLRSYSK
jgi:hypothetical protein